MPSYCLPRRILYGELLSGRHHPGGQKKCFSDNMKLILKCCHIAQNSLRLSPQTGRFGETPVIPAWWPSLWNTRVWQRIIVSDVINQPPSPSLVTVSRTATGLVRRLSACTSFDNDYICIYRILMDYHKQVSIRLMCTDNPCFSVYYGKPAGGN